MRATRLGMTDARATHVFMTKRRTPAREALHRRVVAAVALAIVLVACDWGREPAACECPNLEAAVDEIDWAPGIERVQQESAGEGGFLEVVNQYRSENADSAALETRIVEALESNQYEVSTQAGGAIEGITEGITVTVSGLVPSASSDFPGIRVSVKYEGEDNPEIDDELEPLRLALSTP